MENRFDSKVIVAFVIRWTLYIMVFFVITGTIMEVMTRHNNIALFNTIIVYMQATWGLEFIDIFKCACYTVCISPFISVIVLLIGDILSKNTKAVILGVILLCSLMLSLLYIVVLQRLS